MTYGLIYKLINNNEEYMVTGYEGTDTDVVIPSTYQGNPVTSIGGYAFAYCYSLTSIKIPEGITYIGEHTFEDCNSLTSVTFGENSQLTVIGNYAFINCHSLTSIVIPKATTSIGDYAFCGCETLENIVIPASVTTIGSSAFYNCSSLTSIEIPESVTSIGGIAFYGCDSLIGVIMLATTPPQLDNNVFENTNANLKIYCFSKSLQAYKESLSEYADKIVADDLRLYFIMNSKAQKQYFNADTKATLIPDESGTADGRSVIGVNGLGQQVQVKIGSAINTMIFGNLPQYWYAPNYTSEAIPQGVLITGTPTKPGMAVNKKYVDDIVGNIDNVLAAVLGED